MKFAQNLCSKWFFFHFPPKWSFWDPPPPQKSHFFQKSPNERFHMMLISVHISNLDVKQEKNLKYSYFWPGGTIILQCASATVTVWTAPHIRRTWRSIITLPPPLGLPPTRVSPGVTRGSLLGGWWNWGPWECRSGELGSLPPFPREVSQGSG